MSGIQRRSRFRRFLASPMAMILFIIVAVMVINGAWGLYYKVKVSAEAREISEKELANVLERKSFIESEIFRLKTKEGMEEEIRRKFNVVKEGEEVVLLLGEEEKPEEVLEEEGFFRGFWDKAKAFVGQE